MNKAFPILKKIWKIWFYFCGAVGILLMAIVAFTSLQQSDKDKAFTREHLIPLASYVEIFRNSTGRLPTKAEINSWAETNYENQAVWYFTKKPDFMKDWGITGKDFVVGKWRGEWIQYYSSWNKSSFTK